jgi:hypothetical protein
MKNLRNAVAIDLFGNIGGDNWAGCGESGLDL